jgi:hypothetical protein
MCGAQADNVYVAQPVDESARPSVQACPLLLESVCTSYVSAARIGLGHVRRFVSNSLPRWTTELLCSSAA